MWLFIAIFIALVSVLIFGSTVNTTARAWFIFYSTSFQPAEAAKLILIFYLATWMERKARYYRFQKRISFFLRRDRNNDFSRFASAGFRLNSAFTAIATLFILLRERVRHLAVGLIVLFDYHAGCPEYFIFKT